MLFIMLLLILLSLLLLVLLLLLLPSSISIEKNLSSHELRISTAEALDSTEAPRVNPERPRESVEMPRNEFMRSGGAPISPGTTVPMGKSFCLGWGGNVGTGACIVVIFGGGPMVTYGF